MFGKRKPKEEIPADVVPDLVVDKEEQEEINTTPIPLPVPKPVPRAEPVVEKKKEIKLRAQIVRGEVLDNGIIRTVVISNKSLGEIGEVFDLDE